MAIVIDIPDAFAVSALEPHRRFICLVVLYAPTERATGVRPLAHRRFICLVALYAVRDAVGRVRFDPQSAGWAILQLRDGAWVDYMPPVERVSAVEQTLRPDPAARAARPARDGRPVR
jgi:hypothetical protein